MIHRTHMKDSILTHPQLAARKQYAIKIADKWRLEYSKSKSRLTAALRRVDDGHRICELIARGKLDDRVRTVMVAPDEGSETANCDGRARRGLGDVESLIDFDDRTARRVFQLLLLLLLRLAADRRSRAGCTATTRGRIAPLGHAVAKLSASQQRDAARRCWTASTATMNQHSRNCAKMTSFL